MKTSPLRLCAALLFLVCAASIANAQVIVSEEMERGLRFRNTTPYDGEPVTQRYSYNPGAIFYINGSSRNLYYLDYLDRADRAAKFGYPMPIDPYFDVPPPPPEDAVVVGPPRPVRAGFGFGIFRRR